METRTLTRAMVEAFGIGFAIGIIANLMLMALQAYVTVSTAFIVIWKIVVIIGTMGYCYRRELRLQEEAADWVQKVEATQV